MQKNTEHITNFLGKQAFGVCAWWGDKLGISGSRVRLYFIYCSFITLGSPLLIYLAMAFWLEYKGLQKGQIKPTVWDI